MAIGFFGGWVGRGLWRYGWRRAERFQKSHHLPSLWLRELGPCRHFFPYHAVGEQPEERSWSGVLHFRDSQVRTFPCAPRVVAMALSAVLFEKHLARSGGFGIIFQRIWAGHGFFWGFAELRISGGAETELKTVMSPLSS